MAMKRYFAFLKVLALPEPHHQIVPYHIQDTHWGSFTPLQRCSQYILQPQLTKPWRSKDKLISNILWTPTHGHSTVGWPPKMYIHQLCANTGCCLQDLPRVMLSICLDEDEREWKSAFLNYNLVQNQKENNEKNKSFLYTHSSCLLLKTE